MEQIKIKKIHVNEAQLINDIDSQFSKFQFDNRDFENFQIFSAARSSEIQHPSKSTGSEIHSFAESDLGTKT